MYFDIACVALLLYVVYMEPVVVPTFFSGFSKPRSNLFR